jgi:hypothetical protein
MTGGSEASFPSVSRFIPFRPIRSRPSGRGARQRLIDDQTPGGVLSPTGVESRQPQAAPPGPPVAAPRAPGPPGKAKNAFFLHPVGVRFRLRPRPWCQPATGDRARAQGVPDVRGIGIPGVRQPTMLTAEPWPACSRRGLRPIRPRFCNRAEVVLAGSSARALRSTGRSAFRLAGAAGRTGGVLRQVPAEAGEGRRRISAPGRGPAGRVALGFGQLCLSAANASASFEGDKPVFSRIQRDGLAPGRLLTLTPWCRSLLVQGRRAEDHARQRRLLGSALNRPISRHCRAACDMPCLVVTPGGQRQSCAAGAFWGPVRPSEAQVGDGAGPCLPRRPMRALPAPSHAAGFLRVPARPTRQIEGCRPRSGGR